MTHALLALVLAASVLVHPPVYLVETIAPASATGGDALAVNARGDVAGRIDGGAFTWRDGHLTIYPGVQYFVFDGPYTATATAINKAGVAVGHDGNYQPCVMSGLQFATAVRFANGKMSFVDHARDGLCSFEVDGINDAGTIVGVSAFRGFVRYANGKEIEVKPLSTRPVDNGARASAIDNEGHVVGGTTIDVRDVKMTRQGPDPDAFVIHAFLATFDGRQSMRDLGALPNYPDTYATAIAEDGTVVGYSGTHSAAKWTVVSGPSHAWMWYRGRMTDLGGSSTGDSFAYGVNDRGVVVGCAGPDAVRWVGKHMQRVDDLIDPNSGWHLECARGINRDGIIVGTGSYLGKHVPFRLIPMKDEREASLEVTT